MNCPNCGAVCTETQKYCTQCGTALSTAAPVRKHAHFAPLLILLILSLLGIALFFLDRQSVSGKTAFEVQAGVLFFHEEAYQGPTDVTIAAPDQELFFAIGDKCFTDCDWMTSVQLPDTIQAIGSHAFENCISLRGIQLPDSLKIVDECAFSGCTSLEAVSIPASVSFLAEDAFQNCPRPDPHFLRRNLLTVAGAVQWGLGFRAEYLLRRRQSSAKRPGSDALIIVHLAHIIFRLTHFKISPSSKFLE